MLALLLSTILPALLPVATNAVKEATGKWLGSPGPRTFEESLQWLQAQVSLMEAIAKLDTVVGQPSQWVVDLRASARYIVVFAIIVWAAAAYCIHGEPALVIWIEGTPNPTSLGLLVNSAAFFLLGDRLFQNIKGK